jgi:hypothetical protein
MAVMAECESADGVLVKCATNKSICLAGCWIVCALQTVLHICIIELHICNNFKIFINNAVLTHHDRVWHMYKDAGS